MVLSKLFATKGFEHLLNAHEFMCLCAELFVAYWWKNW